MAMNCSTKWDRVADLSSPVNWPGMQKPDPQTSCINYSIVITNYDKINIK